MSEVLARRHRALTPEETERLLRERLDDGVQSTLVEFSVFTVWVTSDAWAEAARLCRDEWRLAYDMFDCLFGVDAGEDGLDVVAVLYSTTTGNRIVLRTRCEGGREAPVCPSLTDVYRGANWMERETYDMFGVDFAGHPGLEPRLLTVDNFEGWPLRKDFHLAARVVKPWPGVNEPQELDEDGNVIERETRMGDAPGPYDVDKAIAAQAKAANPLPESEQEALEAEQAADTSKEAAPEVELDQETYDRLIAEGKSERMARSKAKAAWMKQKKAAEREAAEAATAGGVDEGASEASEAAGAAGQDAAEPVEEADKSNQDAPGSDDDATAEDTSADADAPGDERAQEAAADDTSGDEGGDAREKAEQRRREQAEARARKAAERAAASEETDDTGQADQEPGSDDGDGQEGA